MSPPLPSPRRSGRRGRRLGFVLALVAGSLAQVPPAAADSPVSPGGLAALDWMAGCWTGVADGVRSVEVWTSPDDGGLVGLHKDTAGGRMVGFEFFRIVEVEGRGICYLSSPGGAPPTPFCLLSLAGEKAVFENPAHDFPQRILYWREADRLHARIEGTVDGAVKSADWAWGRCSNELGAGAQ